MQIIKAIILGLIQGLTEFLPVSSSGHLSIFKNILGFESANISFEIFLHFGSLIAVLIYFRKEIAELFVSTLKIKSNQTKDLDNKKIVLYLLIATIVTGSLGIIFKDTFESLFESPLFASIMLFLTGTIIFISDKAKSGRIKLSEMGIIRSLLIGFGQFLSILPGISRSGTTIAISIFAGIKRESAARFSFLLSIPAILGAIVLSISDMTKLSSQEWIAYILGASAAFISGYLVISILIDFVKKQKLKYFSYYCWGLSGISTTYFLINGI